jgi:hypothetical protein
MTYGEMALCNIAFCYGQLADIEKTIYLPTTNSKPSLKIPNIPIQKPKKPYLAAKFHQNALIRNTLPTWRGA